MAEIRGKMHENKVVIVTGSAIGNGQAFAAEFAQHGAQVVLADIEQQQETVERLRAIPNASEPFVMEVDVTSEDDTRRMAAEVRCAGKQRGFVR
jgi:NAD(P)-dependent dehydrogenase (short-subunit alcohol dehydrogenase family)